MLELVNKIRDICRLNVISMDINWPIFEPSEFPNVRVDDEVFVAPINFEPLFHVDGGSVLIS